MGDLHQYELHYNYREGGVFAQKKRLVWAYTVQEAVYQLTLELTHHGVNHVITEAGPVKKVVFADVSHCHVCPECQDVVACDFGGCPTPERSDSGPCYKCAGRKPHRHYCPICAAEYDCKWVNEKISWCVQPDLKELTCSRHTFEEAQAFFQAKQGTKKKATP